MAKKTDNTVKDALLLEAQTATESYVCSGEPASGADAAIDAVKLHVAAYTPSFGGISGAGGRQYTVATESGLVLDNVGGNPNATHIATRVGVVLKVVTTINGGVGVPVSQNDTVAVSPYDHTVGEAT